MSVNSYVTRVGVTRAKKNTAYTNFYLYHNTRKCFNFKLINYNYININNYN